MSNAKTEQQNFLKFSHNSEETLKKYSDFKVGEITYFLRATYHYEELNVWRPEDLTAQEWVKLRLKWVVMEKYVNQNGRTDDGNHQGLTIDRASVT
eukprot:scaffold82143_cov23-Cyclotella_meneghiniana.AAC.1